MKTLRKYKRSIHQSVIGTIICLSITFTLAILYGIFESAGLLAGLIVSALFTMTLHANAREDRITAGRLYNIDMLDLEALELALKKE